MRLLQRENVLVGYPSSDAISLTDCLQQMEQRRNTAKPEDAKITVVFLDATWKYAREMHMANQSTGQYPSHMICVALNADDWEFQNRFDIRTPPSPNHLSTAECIAWVISVIEEDPLLYDTLMRPLDLMVEKWHSYNQKRSFTDGDGTMEVPTAKKRKRG
jgi:DTW domain-containing protein YfiP